MNAGRTRRFRASLFSGLVLLASAWGSSTARAEAPHVSPAAPVAAHVAPPAASAPHVATAPRPLAPHAPPPPAIHLAPPVAKPAVASPGGRARDLDPALFQSAEAAPGRVRPLTSPAGLLEPKVERVVHLDKARVILADYPLIKHDFADALAERFQKPIDAVSNDEIDGWLLESTAYVSAAQAKQTAVNTPIPHTVEKTPAVTAFRPQDYGRALVFQPKPGVLIDVKGAGAVKPKQGDHSNGLATLGEAIREYAYEHLVHDVLTHAGRGDRTVGHYAVIDAGFDVKQPDGRTDPAGLILRQAHSRAKGDLSALGNHDTTRVEATLRRYGITSAGAYQEEPYDSVNLQGTADGAVLDFGGFLVMNHFDKPAYHFDRTPEAGPKYKPLLSEDKVWVEPHDDVRVPVEQWGTTVSGRADPVADNPNIWSHELATAIREGRAGRRDAEQHMHNLLDPVEARLAAHPTAPRGRPSPTIFLGKPAEVDPPKSN